MKAFLINVSADIFVEGLEPDEKEKLYNTFIGK